MGSKRQGSQSMSATEITTSIAPQRMNDFLGRMVGDMGVAASAPLVLVGDRLVVSGSNEHAMSVSPYTGAILGRQKLSGAASLAPVVAADTVYVTTDDGKLLALR